MPRAGLDRARVLAEASAIADAEGLSRLTLARLASALNVRPPSLYNHVASLEAVLEALTAQGLRDLLVASRHAVAEREGFAALRAVAHTQRRYAGAHPGRYAATLRSVALHGPEAQQAGEAYLAFILEVLAGCGVEGESALHAVRCLRAALRGFIDLEHGGGFGMPLEVDRSFEALLDMLEAGVRAM